MTGPIGQRVLSYLLTYLLSSGTSPKPMYHTLQMETSRFFFPFSLKNNKFYPQSVNKFYPKSVRHC